MQFALIESLLYADGFRRLERHLARLEKSALELGFEWTPGAAREALLEQARSLGDGGFKVRLQLERSGDISVTAEPVVAPAGDLTVILAGDRLDSRRPMAHHKTTERDLFGRCFAAATALGAHEVLFLNERGELAEAANSNVFLKFGSELLTPPLSAGILPGVFRQELLEANPAAREEILFASDLQACDSIHLCNSVRGLRTVTLLSGTLGIQGGGTAAGA